MTTANSTLALHDRAPTTELSYTEVLFRWLELIGRPALRGEQPWNNRDQERARIRRTVE